MRSRLYAARRTRPARSRPRPQQIVTMQSGQFHHRYHQGNQTIVIEPSNPQVVYVPTYNPTTVYGGTTAVYPGYSGTDMLAASLLSFGAGLR